MKATGSEPQSFVQRLGSGETLLLDAALGTELDRRGLTTSLPLWSALGPLERPDLVRAIHVDNLDAGADAITTATFRTTARTLAKAGLDRADAPRLDEQAVALAQEARRQANRPDALIAGSIAPLEDCYSPSLTPPPDHALDEHRAQARTLAEAGVDLLVVETMPTIGEAVVALRAARETGLAATVGVVVAPPGDDEVPRLLSGETLADAVAAFEPLGPAAILVNCAAPDVITAALRELRRLTDLPIGGYANLGEVDEERGWEPDAEFGGGRYAESAAAWLALGAQIVGGCCGTTPEHTAALRRLLDARRRTVGG